MVSPTGSPSLLAAAIRQFSGVVEEIAGDGAPDRAGQKDAVTETALAALPGLKVGDRVMGVTRFGAFADQVVLPAHQAKPLPEGWDFAQGAAFLVQGLTAIYGLKSLGDIRKGQRVLVHSAAGGVGMFALGICEAVGATPVATVGSDAKACAAASAPSIDANYYEAEQGRLTCQCPCPY